MRTMDNVAGTTRRSFLMTGAVLAAGGAEADGGSRTPLATEGCEPAHATEVCVAGCGPAGFVAAIAAKRGVPVQQLDRVAIRHILESAGAVTKA